MADIDIVNARVNDRYRESRMRQHCRFTWILTTMTTNVIVRCVTIILLIGAHSKSESRKPRRTLPENGFNGFSQKKWKNIRREKKKHPTNFYVCHFPGGNSSLRLRRLVPLLKNCLVPPNDVSFVPIGRFMHGFGNLLAYVSEWVSVPQQRQHSFASNLSFSSRFCHQQPKRKACAFQFGFYFLSFLLLFLLFLNCLYTRIRYIRSYTWRHDYSSATMCVCVLLSSTAIIWLH